MARIENSCGLASVRGVLRAMLGVLLGGFASAVEQARERVVVAPAAMRAPTEAGMPVSTRQRSSREVESPSAGNAAPQDRIVDRASIELRADVASAVVGQTVEVAVVVRIEQRLWREQLIQLFRQQTDVAVRIATPWQGGLDGFDLLGPVAVPGDGASATVVVDGTVARLLRRDDEVRDGATFACFELAQRLVCRRAGTLQMERAELQFSWAPRFVEDLLGERVPEGRTDTTLRSEPLAVEVVELPGEGRPREFSGFVGEVSVVAVLEAGSEMRVADSAVLRVTVAGSGDLKALRMPVLKSLEGFVVRGHREEMEPGRRVVVHELVAARAGAQRIPPIDVSFYSPRRGGYAVASTQEIAVAVAPAPDGATELPGHAVAHEAKGSGAGGAARAKEEELREPVPGIDVPFGPVPVERLEMRQPVPDFGRARLPGAFAVVAWLVAPWGLFAVVMGWRRFVRMRPERVRRLRRRNALRSLRAGLGMPGPDRHGVFVAFLAVWLDRAESAIVGPLLQRRMVEAGVDAALAARVERLLDELAAPRFGGTQRPPADAEVIALAVEVERELVAREKGQQRDRSADRGGAVTRAFVVLCLLGSASAQGPEETNTDLPTIARRLLEAGEPARAFDAYAKALDEGWHEPGALCFGLAICAQRLGRPADAVLWYERALAVDPMRLEARANLRLVRQQLGLVEREQRALLGLAVGGVVEDLEAVGPRPVLVLGAVLQFAGLLWIASRRRRGIAVAVLVLGVGASGFGAFWAWGESGERAVVRIAGSRFVAEPHERSSAVGALVVGEVVEVMESSPRWARVRQRDVVGWVETRSLSSLRY